MKDYYNKSAEDRTPFNFAALLLIRLDLLFARGNEAAVLGDYDIWFRVLKAIKRSLSFKLEEEEAKEVETMFTKTSPLITNKALQMNIENELDKIETRLIVLMFKYGLYYPKYNKKTWEQEAQEEDV